MLFAPIGLILFLLFLAVPVLLVLKATGFVVRSGADIFSTSNKPATYDLPTKQCANCKAIVSSNYKYCPFCQTSLQKTCSKCGTVLNSGYRYCPSCGQEN